MNKVTTSFETNPATTIMCKRRDYCWASVRFFIWMSGLTEFQRHAISCHKFPAWCQILGGLYRPANTL